LFLSLFPAARDCSFNEPSASVNNRRPAANSNYHSQGVNLTVTTRVVVTEALTVKLDNHHTANDVTNVAPRFALIFAFGWLILTTF
jgi:hypothetical protein